MEHEESICELRGDNRRLIGIVAAFLAFGGVAGYIIAVQGFVTLGDALAVAALALMCLASLVGGYFNRRYRVVLSSQGLTVDHPWERFSVDWANVIDVVPVYYGVMEVRVRDASAVQIRNSAFVRWFKRRSGQPFLTFSTKPLAGGERRFTHCLQEVRAGRNPR